MLVMAMDQARTAPRGAMRQRRYTSQSSSSPPPTASKPKKRSCPSCSCINWLKAWRQAPGAI